MPKAVYGNYKFNLEPTPWNGRETVTGQEIKERVASQINEEPIGAPYVIRRDGSMVTLGAEESIQLNPDDSIGLTAPFETA